MKKFIAEFKEFALKGNMIDLAIGMIIATSFNAVVKSIVDDLLMPAFAFIFGKSDFSQLVAFAEYAEDGTLVGGIKYGMFIQNIVNFTIIAVSLFVMVKLMNKLKNPKPVEEAPAEPAPKPDDIALLEEIRDLLAKEKVNS
ncbi:MAG: large conductance mechanosensitive channel protein MscL [Clostridia bacterium]|nr:large conductance mechanosensitive channel protein MscL [Clostridia bacterium]